jgi:hypothetical protein
VSLKVSQGGALVVDGPELAAEAESRLTREAVRTRAGRKHFTGYDLAGFFGNGNCQEIKMKIKIRGWGSSLWERGIRFFLSY